MLDISIPCMQVSGDTTFAVVQHRMAAVGKGEGVARPVRCSWRPSGADIDVDQALPVVGTRTCLQRECME